jgi:CelD/BcsL family acetyltransferase involved in cellulose biosynthesis
VDSPLGQRLMLGGVLARGGVLERLRLSPEGHSLADMKRLTRLCHAAGQRVFTLAFHSPSLKPGCTAYARDAAARDALLARVARYVGFFRDHMNGCVSAPGDLAETLRQIEETGRDPAFGRGPRVTRPAGKRPAVTRGAAPLSRTTDTSDPSVEIFLEPVESPAQAAKLWQPLAERAPRSGFLGWPWIGTWLLHLPHQVRPMLLGARQGGQVVALSLIARRREQRHRMELIQDRLHEAGDPVLDRIMLEHNDILVAPEAPPDIRERLFDGLLSRPDAPDEIVARHLRPEALAALDRAAARHGRIRHDAHVRRHDFVDLNGLRLAGRDYLDLLGPNTRAAIRRSERLYAGEAPIVVEPARDTAEALEVFESLVARHQARWAARGKQGAFGTKGLYLFHRMTVKAGVPRGEVELLRVRAGDTVLGELYNIRRGGWICQYQSGLVPPADNRHKPGLVAHAAAVRHYAKQGADRYDFLVGDSRYKTDLATAREDLTSLTVAPAREPFHLVAAAQHSRESLARRTRRAQTLD